VDSLIYGKKQIPIISGSESNIMLPALTVMKWVEKFSCNPRTCLNTRHNNASSEMIFTGDKLCNGSNKSLCGKSPFLPAPVQTFI